MSSDGDQVGQRLFRLWVRSGTPFAVQPHHNPVVQHDGGTTVTHLVLSPAQAVALRELLEDHGGVVDLTPSAKQTPEQKTERETLLGVGREGVVWPSGDCPLCSWFDPLLPDVPCGRAGWPPETIATFLKSEKPQRDATACPVPHVWRAP